MLKIEYLVLIVLIAAELLAPAAGLCEYNLATGEEEFILISTEKEISMGQALSKQVEEKIKPDTDYLEQERIDMIGQKLAAVCDKKDLIYHFKVLDEKEEENAFALPGGYIYVFSGLISKLDNDDQLAAILAHEIGHTCARHAAKRLQSGIGYTLLNLLISQGANDNYTRYKANEALGQLMLSYSREQELEADRLAVKYMKKAGYDPKAVIVLLNKLLKSQMQGPVRPKRYWYTHPYLAARISATEQEINGLMSFDDYMNRSPDEDYIIEY